MTVPVIDNGGDPHLPAPKSINPGSTPHSPCGSHRSIHNLAQLLARAAVTEGGLSFYTSADESAKPCCVSYAELQQNALQKSRLLSMIDGVLDSSIVLLHFDTQLETIEWFWAATLAGLLPAISGSFVHDTAQRIKHLNHLQTLLKQPTILTSEKLLHGFYGAEGLRLRTIESLINKVSNSPADTGTIPGTTKCADDPAVLMLTSGSTGSAKAVPLLHGQLLTAIQGKSTHHLTQPGDVFLNWVGLDHVASLCEIHLHAGNLGAQQVHIPATLLLQDPLRFIRLLDTHRVAYTFAPNFFLNQLRKAILAHPPVKTDLSCLKRINSGGEANPTAACDSISRELCHLGARGPVISPGFGMTETCAGAVHAQPILDTAKELEFASLGKCIPGMKMRVMDQESKDKQVPCGEVGELQLTGPVVFHGYFNDPAATAAAFTDDKWFVTGDLAWQDQVGNLNLAGRITDIIIVNGIKWSATEIETAIDEEGITGLIPSFTVAFPHRPTGSPTEDIAVVYSPSYASDDDAARFATATAISKTVAAVTGRNPGHLVPLPVEMLVKTSLGKIPRSKVRAAFQRGDYESYEKRDREVIREYGQSKLRRPETENERKVQRVLAQVVNVSVEAISSDSSIFDLGITSFNLILLKALIQEAVQAPVDIPMSDIMMEPTVAGIASSVDRLLSQAPVYNPIVPLQLHGTKIPLFLIHPGSGDILVFIALATHFPTRPVYALRTRGYNANDSLFETMEETIDTYVQHIRKVQPHGPYAVAGYSLGSTLAFEVGKKLEAQGQEVRFLASIDYPPHISQYVRGQNWLDVLLHISFFLELIDDEIMARATVHMHSHEMTREEALKYVLFISDPQRVQALQLTPELLERIGDIGENFRVHGEAYEPVGNVDHLDVFVADPPGYAALNRQDWRDNKLGQWVDFVRTDAEFYECPGIHANMLNPEYAAAFVKIFKAAMKLRGV
ncbi:acetyl-CoA synthetase-like protein [Aspergillus candidus]|uniref:Acetyl-CoA synthetase-like protein n=1 Tax=Aspergillus candidus TaxID=41067 RepID=A0A2I2EXN2_ASPCN|nr:acetyl-CoA synthetase-like protein [Aspergillus candidus]PLB33146.1 acetyl-CoA synthetase-like protein [Aspergillus candidus]